MTEIYYGSVLVISTLLTLLYAYTWHKRNNLFITLLFVMIPISNLGYILQTFSDSLDGKLAGLKVIYLGGCYHIVFVMFSIISLCRINVPKYVHAFVITVNTLIYSTVCLAGKTDIFYKSLRLAEADGEMVIEREYGPVHTLFLVIIISYTLVSFAVMIYAFNKKNDVSRYLIALLFIVEFLSLGSYLFRKSISATIELMPLSYVLAQVVFLLITHRVCLYDITDTGIDSLAEKGLTGFISFDFKYKYLGSNETAKSFFPELKEIHVDRKLTNDMPIGAAIIGWLKLFEEDSTQDTELYPKDDRVYLIKISHLFDGKHDRGYQLFVTDDTKNQMYNTMLENEVAEKTRHIIEMHDRLVLSMATMVESRDNSTGGHIKRTSEGVRILISEMRKDDDFELSGQFCRNVIKAAPMHDLGKIAVDDAILRKPGRFTPEEFEIMKSHSAEGAKIVRQILEGTDDDEFKVIAENVAHYHHERWDGSGYPDGLKGEEIPLEARIMAVADVYDALVSKRVYKEKMSFEKANEIIMEGMGTHFDKRLEKYYIAARPELEKYYSSLDT